MSPWRPQFETALAMLAQIHSTMDDLGFYPPILVGGNADHAAGMTRRMKASNRGTVKAVSP